MRRKNTNINNVIKKVIFVSVVINLFAGYAIGGSKIEGLVYNPLTREAVAGVKIMASTTSDIKEEQGQILLYATSNNKGSFLIRNCLPNRTYSIQPDNIYSSEGLTSSIKVSTPDEGLTRLANDTVFFTSNVPRNFGVYRIADKNRFDTLQFNLDRMKLTRNNDELSIHCNHRILNVKSMKKCETFRLMQVREAGKNQRLWSIYPLKIIKKDGCVVHLSLGGKESRTLINDKISFRCYNIYPAREVALYNIELCPDNKQTDTYFGIKQSNTSQMHVIHFTDSASNSAPKRGKVKIKAQNILEGPRSEGSVMRVVMMNLAALRYQYNKMLREDITLEGFVTVKFAIDNLGKVFSCNVMESTMNDSVLENMIVGKITNWYFDEITNSNDTTEVLYQFGFSCE